MKWVIAWLWNGKRYTEEYDSVGDVMMRARHLEATGKEVSIHTKGLYDGETLPDSSIPVRKKL